MNNAHVSNLLLHLSLIEGIGPATIKKIVGSSNQLPNFYNFNTADFSSCGISSTSAQKLIVGLANKRLLEQELELIAQHNIKWTTFLSSDYPEQLKHIAQPPVVLYWRGAKPKNMAHQIALVGSRKGSAYAQRAIDAMVPELVAQGWTTVSGGALGVDSMVHVTTLQAGGQTVAVLGSGLLRPYPLSNKKLFDEIVRQGGTLLSAFPLTMEAMPGNFPARNRIIAGLSRGCLVVQAAKKSGALITAHYALEQGRDVFAVPGDLNDPLSAGCHALIRQGAVLTRNAEDILAEFGQMPVRGMQATKNEAPPSGPEDIILQLCRTPAAVEVIAQAVEMNLAQTQSLLFDLQLRGKVAQQFTGLWQTN